MKSIREGDLAECGWDLAEFVARCNRVWMRSSQDWMRCSREWMRSSREWIRSIRVWMRSSWGWTLRSNRVCGWMRSSVVWMRHSQCGWDLAKCGWDVAECGWELSECRWDVASHLGIFEIAATFCVPLYYYSNLESSLTFLTKIHFLYTVIKFVSIKSSPPA